MLRNIWRAASKPQVWFQQLDELEVDLWRASRNMFLSGTVGFLVLGLAFMSLTRSSAFLPILSFALALGLPFLLILWMLGGLVLVRPANLDLRAWELTAWSWVPAGIMGLSLLPVAWLFPLASMIVGLAGAQIWHLIMVKTGLEVFSPERARTPFVLYVTVVVIVPFLLFALLFAFLAQTRGSL